MPEQANETNYIGLCEAAKLLGKAGRNGKPIHPATLNRWIHAKRLKAVKIGGKWATTREWVEEFIAASTYAALPTGSTPTIRSPEQRDRDVEAALEELRKRGC